MRSAETIGEPLGHRLDRVDQVGVGLELVAGEEAGGPEHAQRVVGEGLLGRQRRAQHLGGQVGRAAEGVDERRGVGQRQRHGVDGEVAPGQVGLDVGGEDDVGLAGVGV